MSQEREKYHAPATDDNDTWAGRARHVTPHPVLGPLETMDLDGLGIQLQAFFFVNEEFLHILALVALQLNHFAHFRIIDDGAIARELLLDHLQDLLLVEFLWQALHCRQSFAAIALCAHSVSVRDIFSG